MIKRIFSTFLGSLAESYKLQQRYRRITTHLGWVTVALAMLSFIPVMYRTWIWLGLPLEGGPIDGLRLKLLGWIVVTILLLPMALYLGMVLVYGSYGLLMFGMRRFSWRQAVDFGCRATYPRHWYREDT